VERTHATRRMCPIPLEMVVIMIQGESVLRQVTTPQACQAVLRLTMTEQSEKWLTRRRAAWLELALKGLGLLLGMLLLIQ
jgi:hypothetical protein